MKLNNKIVLSTLCASLIALSGCSSDSDSTTTTSTSTSTSTVTYGATLEGDITADRTLTLADSPVLLSGNKIKVKDGATLTIEPGVKLCGESQAYLIITKGSQLIANGTEAEPIVFDSIDSCVDSTVAAAGQWGGVTLLGQAVTNEADNIAYEVDESDPDFAYGGIDDTDSSGSLKYVEIHSSGYAVAPDKEVNGLSLCGVGSGTTVDNITIMNSGDDGVEIWGGAVNLSNISITGAQDDGFDVDSGYHGAVKNLTVTQTEPGAALIEMTNGGDATKQRTDWSLDGFTLTASENQVKEGGLYFKDLDVTGTFKNGVINMGTSPVANTAAGLNNKEGVYASPIFENVIVKSSVSVPGATSGDIGIATLDTAFNVASLANAYISSVDANMTYNSTLQGDIIADTTLTIADSPVLLSGNKIKVKDGATLTIDAGVTLCGESEAYLIVTKGSKLIANGTATNPIVFNSEAACNGAPDASGQWGGVTLLGQAVTNEAATIAYEVDEADADFAYGGSDDTDNSGSLNYVAILNSGYAVAPDKEVNGLSLCGVGNGTTVDNITILNSGDDGVEIWGGAVTLNNISITGAQDDSFDVDSGYHGGVTNLYVRQTTASAALIEMTNGGDATVQRTDWILDGFTLTASQNQVKEGGIYFKDLDVTGTFENGLVDMSNSPATNTAAGLTNKEGVFSTPVFNNVLVKGSESVAVTANLKDGTTIDTGTTQLNDAFVSGTGNTFSAF